MDQIKLISQFLKPIMGFIILIHFSALGGCSKTVEAPEGRFLIFVNALKAQNSKSVLDSVTDSSRKALLSQGSKKTWISILSEQTRSFSPQISKTEWLIRNQKARVYYTDSSGSQSFLTLIRKNERFYIHLGDGTKTRFSALSPWSPKSKTIPKETQ
jgi:hypothetical protein